jgi:predicted deacylase
LAKAFAPPVILHSGLIDKSFRKAAYKKGKHILVYETGESLRFDQNGIQEGINGTLRLLKHLEMIKEAPEPHLSEIYENSDWIRASFAGLYHSKIELGNFVEKGMNIGSITDPFGNEKKILKSKFEGRVIGFNNCPVVHKGDALLHIATQRKV